MIKILKAFISQHRFNMLKNEVGAVILLYALAIIPIFGMLGIAIDTGRILYVNTVLSGAVDSAAIAGARAGGSNANITQAALAVFEANIPSSFIGTVTGPSIDITQNGHLVTVIASGQINTTFMQIFGQKTITTTEESGALISPPTEVVLALDNTGSMSGAPMTTEIAAATLFLNTVYGGANIDTLPNFYVSVVPYTTTVNISQIAANPSSWLTAAGQTQIKNTNLYPNIPPIAGKSVGGQWMGCIEARTPPLYPAGMDTNDTSPSGAGLFTPFLYPSTLQHSYAYGAPLNRVSPLGTAPWNNPVVLGIAVPYPLADLVRGDNDWYLNGTVPAWAGPALFFGDNYNWNGTSDGNNGVGPNLGCPIPAIPLTASHKTVQATVSNMKATFRGGTMINLGLDAAWWIISPNWEGLFNTTYTPVNLPNPYGLANKFIVLMTDGMNQWYDWPTALPGAGSNPIAAPISADADYTGYGRLGEGRSGTTNFAATTPLLNTRMANMCTTLKANGITIFTIIFPHGGGISAGTQTTFQNCASDSSKYFYAASNPALISAFQTIANQINTLRLTWPGKP